MMSSSKFIFFGVCVFLLALSFSSRKVVAATVSPACAADINQDSIVDISDYSILVSNFLRSPLSNTRADINSDTIVDISDYSLLVRSFFQQCIPTATPTLVPTTQPTTPPGTSTGDWSQFGGNPAKTSYSPTIPATPWKYLWQWNGAGADGKRQSNHLTVADNVQPVTGGGRIYMVAGNQVFALNKTNGSVVWSKSGLGSLTATAAYDNEMLYVGSANGTLYKLNASSGVTVATFAGGGTLNQAPTIANGVVYIGSSNGTVYAITAATMTQKWSYAAGSSIVTPAAYSNAKNMIVINSQDLYVHGVNANTGSRMWRVKPTSRTYQAGDPTAAGAQFEWGWPVIAEQHGIVFVRYRLDWDTIWNWSPYPSTNAAIRANLISQPNQQALFALNLNDGSVSFIPAVGNGGQGDGGMLPLGPLPVIRTVGGQEVAYIIWRNAQTAPTSDGREDASMGEMVLDGSTVPGYAAGDVRFVKYEDIQTDEMVHLSMGGNILFHSHWLVNEAFSITDRSNGLGATFTNPIQTTPAPFVIWRQAYCPASNQNCNPGIYPGAPTTPSFGPSSCPFDGVHRYCSQGLYSYGDGRGYPAGFYEYHNDFNEGDFPSTSITSDQVIVRTLDGGIMVLANGNPTASAQTPYIAQDLKNSEILGATTQAPAQIAPTQARKHLNEHVVVTGTLATVVNHRPKAMYLSFSQNHSDSLLVRVFEKDLSKFTYDLSTLEGKKIEVSGFVTLYWPYVKDPEIIVTSPQQIRVIQ